MPQLANAAKAATECVLSRTFDASREDVWNAFTQSEHLKHWWGIPGASLEIASLDLKPGGLFLYCMKLADGRAMWARSIFREVDAPERLVWLNGFTDEHGVVTANPWMPDMPQETLNTMTLVEQDGKTLLTLTVAPFNASDEEARVFARAIPGMKMGLGAVYEGLAKYLAHRS